VVTRRHGNLAVQIQRPTEALVGEESTETGDQVRRLSAVLVPEEMGVPRADDALEGVRTFLCGTFDLRDTGPDKSEIPGIDDPCAYESPCLAGAAARIGRVGETALAAHPTKSTPVSHDSSAYLGVVESSRPTPNSSRHSPAMASTRTWTAWTITMALMDSSRIIMSRNIRVHSAKPSNMPKRARNLRVPASGRPLLRGDSKAIARPITKNDRP